MSESDDTIKRIETELEVKTYMERLSYAIKRELLTLLVANHIETASDENRPDKSEFRIFAKVYPEDDVYIKFRVELLSGRVSGNTFVLVMLFHYSTIAF